MQRKTSISHLFISLYAVYASVVHNITDPGYNCSIGKKKVKLNKC